MSSRGSSSRLSRVLSFGKSKKKKATTGADDGSNDAANGDDNHASTPAPPPDPSPKTTPRRRFSFGRRPKRASEAQPATLPAADEGMLVGEDVTIRGLDGREDLEGVPAEAILYDFYEKLYTVFLSRNGRRLQVAAENLKKRK